jgi:hypothetical protein
MPLRSLPHRPSLEHLRNEARELQRRLREGDPSALALAREFHPRFLERAEQFGLSDAQLTVARSYGYPSWPSNRSRGSGQDGAARTAGIGWPCSSAVIAVVRYS